MNDPARISRRALLLGAVGVAASMVARPPSSWLSVLRISGSPAERLTRLVTHQPSALTIGRAYIRRVPAEADTDVLAALLAASLPGGRRTIERAPDARLHQLVQDATREDFDALRIVEVDGWVLARTEARLCGLVAARAGRRRI